VLFNIDGEGKPIIRKASAHGLGHLKPPYSETEAPADIPAPAVALAEIGVERWLYDFWYRIAEAALKGSDEIELGKLPGFGRPAVSRYAATTPSLLNWFRRYNAGRAYADQVKPFNFLLMYQTSTTAWLLHQMQGNIEKDEALEPPRVVSVYDEDASAHQCFDRLTGERVSSSILQSYAQALAQYHVHSESKFQNGEGNERGETLRWHVQAEFIEYIGKEANR
jgi:hypothetical protein